MSQVNVTQVVVELMAPFTEGNTAQSGVGTFRFGAGEGTEWYYVAPIVDSGDELRSKTIKSVRATGRITNGFAKIYGYDVSDGIDLQDLEDGTNSSTGPISIDDTSFVTQSPRFNVNVPNCVLSTVRIEGDGRGQSERNQLHEVVLEQASAGVRR